MDLQTLFQDYYTQYRGEASIPPVTDPEYTIFIRLAREAVARWASYDNTYWKELFTTLQQAPDGDNKIRLGKTAYLAPSDMKEAGGFMKVIDANKDMVRKYPIIEPQEAQFRGEGNYYCYFTGDAQNGFTLNINPTPDSSIVGLSFDYIYYKQPTLWTITSNPTDTTEMSEPMFIVHRALANRFRATRNPYYSSAKADGEDALKIMQMANNSGNWSEPWSVTDNSGTVFGQEYGSW